MNIYEQLLSEIESVMKKQHEEFDNKNAEYSILRVLDIWHNEVLLTKILGDLLNPKGQHNCGTYFLEKFIRRIPRLQRFNIHDLDKTEAFLEYEHQVNNRNRRMDIYLRNREMKLGIPIEVKIWAPDSPAQCYDYYQFASMENSTCYLVYLTLDGHSPSELSTHGDGGSMLYSNNIITLSFNTDIREIIEETLKEDVASEEVKMVLKQYIECLIHCDNSNLDGESTIDKKAYEAICKNTETKKAAFELEDAIFLLKRDAITNVFIEFDKQINAPYQGNTKYSDLFEYPLVNKGADIENMVHLVENYMKSDDSSNSIYRCYQLEGLEASNYKYKIVFGLAIFLKEGFFNVGIYAYDKNTRDFIETRYLRFFTELKDIFPAAASNHTVLLYKTRIPSDYEAACVKPFSIKARQLVDSKYVENMVHNTLEYVKNEFLRELCINNNSF